MRVLALAGVFLSLLVADANGAAPQLKRGPRRTSNATLRKRLHINDLITEPGTIEIDWGNLYSRTTTEFTMPTALKATPAGNSVLWGRTEYSIGFDTVASTLDTGIRTTRFSDAVTFAATSVIFDSAHFDIAVAPQATFFLRDASGARLGATAIGRADVGLNSIGVTAGWTAATSSSSSNPAGTWDVGAGFGRHLAVKGALSRFTPHINGLWERSTGLQRSLAAFAGMEYQITSRLAFDATGQRVGVAGGADRQALVSMTINLGGTH